MTIWPEAIRLFRMREKSRRSFLSRLETAAGKSAWVKRVSAARDLGGGKGV